MSKFDGLLDKLLAKEKFLKETPEQWEERHKGHVTEEWTPERPFEDRSLHCHDCKRKCGVEAQ